MGRRWLVLALGFVVLFGSSVVQAKPKGQKVSRGRAKFSQQGDVTTIRASNKAVIDYSSFDIAQPETVRFIQPSSKSRVLNRIHSAKPTQIDGALKANGRVYLVNPAGVLFGNGAVIDVAGLYAAAGQITNAHFLNNIDHFTGVTGSVVNYGTIDATLVHLIGQQVANHGNIVTGKGGIVTMSAGDDVLLGMRGGHIMVRITGQHDQGAGDPSVAAVENTGTINAGKGMVKLGAGDLYALGIHQTSTGKIAAKDISVQGGQDSVVIVAGTLDASDTRRKATGGTVQVTGDKIALDDPMIDVSGSRGGGTVEIGGSFQGNGPLPNASQTNVGTGTVIRADALNKGDGGLVVVWADNLTRYYGSISAKGGPKGGDGGFVEVSGKLDLDFSGAVDTMAPLGDVGELLLDPFRTVVVSGGGQSLPPGDVVDFDETGTGNSTINDPGGIFGITATTLQSANANITLRGINEVEIDENLTLNAGFSLTIESGRLVDIRRNITTDGADITITANVDLPANIEDNENDPITATDDFPAEILMLDGTIITTLNSGDITLLIDDGGNDPNTASGNIRIEHLDAAGSVTVTNNGPTSGSNILIASPSTLVTAAGGASFEVTGAAGDSSIGSLASPIPLAAGTNLVARTQTGDAFFDSAGGLTVGGVTIGGLSDITGTGDVDILAGGAILAGNAVGTAEITSTGVVFLDAPSIGAANPNEFEIAGATGLDITDSGSNTSDTFIQEITSHTVIDTTIDIGAADQGTIQITYFNGDVVNVNSDPTNIELGTVTLTDPLDTFDFIGDNANITHDGTGLSIVGTSSFTNLGNGVAADDDITLNTGIAISGPVGFDTTGATGNVNFDNGTTPVALDDSTVDGTLLVTTNGASMPMGVVGVAITQAAGSTLTLNNTSTLDSLANDADIVLGGGTINFGAGGSLVFKTAGTTGDVLVDTGASNLDLGSQIDLTGSTITGGFIGRTDLNATVSSALVIGTGSRFAIQAGGNVNIDSSITLNNGVALFLEADSPNATDVLVAADGTGTLNFNNAPVLNNNGSITLMGTDFTFSMAGAVTTNGINGDVTIAQSQSGQALGLGGAAGAILNVADLGKINASDPAATLTIGQATSAGDDGVGTGEVTSTTNAITIGGVNFGATNVALVSSGTIDDNANNSGMSPELETTGTVTLIADGDIGFRAGDNDGLEISTGSTLTIMPLIGAGGSVRIVDVSVSGVDLAASDIGVDLDLTTTMGPVVQNGTLGVGGNADIDASGAITHNAQLTVGSNATFIAGGPITQPGGKLLVTGSASFTTNVNDQSITLGDVNNSIAGPVSFVTQGTTANVVFDNGSTPIILNSATPSDVAGTATLTTTGAIDDNAGNAGVNNMFAISTAVDLTLNAGTAIGGDLAVGIDGLEVSVAGNLSATSGGAAFDSITITDTGNTGTTTLADINAVAGNVAVTSLQGTLGLVDVVGVVTGADVSLIAANLIDAVNANTNVEIDSTGTVHLEAGGIGNVTNQIDLVNATALEIVDTGGNATSTVFVREQGAGPTIIDTAITVENIGFGTIDISYQNGDFVDIDDSLVISDISLGVPAHAFSFTGAGGNITQLAGGLSFAGTALFANTTTNADIILNDMNNAITGPSFATIGAGSQVIFDNGTTAVVLSPTGFMVGGGLSVTTGGTITQSGPIATVGSASFTTDLDDRVITLGDPLNAIASGAGSTVTFTTQTVGTNLGRVTFDNGSTDIDFATSTVAGDLIVTTGGAMTQAGALTVAGISTFTTDVDDQPITLGDAGNNLAGTVSFNTQTSGANGGNVIFDSGVNSIDFATSSVGGALTVNADGPITQTGGSLRVDGASSFTTDVIDQPITLTDATNAFTGAVGFSTTGTLGDVNVLNGSLLTLGASTVGDTLVATGDGVTVAGALVAPASVTLTSNSATGDVIVNVSADITATAGGITLTSENDVSINAAVVGTGGTVRVTADGVASDGVGAITGTGSLTSSSVVDLFAATGISNGAGGPLAVSSPALGADNSGDAPINIANTSAAATSVFGFQNATGLAVPSPLGTITFDQAGGGDVTFVNLPVSSLGGAISLSQSAVANLTIAGTSSVTSGTAGLIDGGDITVASNGGLSVNGVISSAGGSGGALTLRGFNLAATPVIGAGTVTLQGGNPDLVITAPLSVATPLNLEADRDVVIQNVVRTTTPGDAISLTADFDADMLGGVQIGVGGFVDSQGAVTITGSDFTNQGVTAAGTGESIVIESVSGGIVANGVGSDITLTHSGVAPNSGVADIRIEQFVQSAGGSVTINTLDQGDIRLRAGLSAAGDVTLITGPTARIVNIESNLTIAGTNVVVQSPIEDDGFINTLTITASGLLDLDNSVGGTTPLGQLIATAGSYNITGDVVTTGTGGIALNGGAVTLDGTGAQTLDAGTGILQVANDVIKAAGDLTLDGVLVDFSGAVAQQIDATAGTLQIVPDVTKATGDLTLGGNTLVDLDGLLVDVLSGNLVIDDALDSEADLNASGTVTLNGVSALAGDVIGGTGITFAQAITLDGAGAQTLDAGTGTLQLTQALTKAAGGLTLGGNTLVDLDGALVNVQAGNLVIDDALDSEADLQASGTVTLSGVSALAGDVTAGAGVSFSQDVTFDGGAASTQTVNPGAGKTIFAQGDLIKTTAGDLVLAGGTFDLFSPAQTVNATAGTLQIQGDIISSSGFTDLTLSAGTLVDLDGSQVNLGSGILIVNGPLDSEALTIDAFAVGLNGVSTLAGDVTTNSGITLTQDVTLDGAGTQILDGGGGALQSSATIFSDNVDLRAATGINDGAGGPLLITALGVAVTQTIAVDNTGAAPVDIANTSAIPTDVTQLQTSTDPAITMADTAGTVSFVQSGGGDVTFSGPGPVSSKGGAINLTQSAAATDLAINAGVTVASGAGGVTGGDITLSTGGSLTLNGTIDSTGGVGGTLSLRGFTLAGMPTLTVGAGTISLVGTSPDLIIMAPLIVDTPITLESDGDVLIQNVVQTTTSGDAITLTADIDNNGLGGVQIDGSGGASVGQVISAGAVTMTGSDLDLVSGGAGTGRSIELDGSGLGMGVDQVTAVGDITLLHKQDGAAMAVVPLSGAANILVNGGVDSSGGAIVMDTQNQGNIELLADITAVGDVTLDAGPTAGRIVEVETDNLSITGVNVTVRSPIEDDVAGGSNRTLTVNASGLLDLDGSVGAVTPLGQLVAMAGSYNIAGDVLALNGVTLNGGAVTLDGGVGVNQTLDAGAGTLLAAGDVTKTNAGNLTLDGGLVDLDGSAQVTATGALTFNGPVNLAGNAIGGTGLTYQAGITLDGTGAQTLNAGTGILQLDQNLIKASGDLTLDGASVNLAGVGGASDQLFDAGTGTLRVIPNLTKTTPGNLTLDGLLVDLDGNAQTTGGSLAFDGPVELFGDAIGSTGLTFAAGITLDGAGAQTLDAGTGTLQLTQDLAKGAGNLILDGGVVDVNGNVEATNGALSFNGPANLAGDAIGGAGLTFAAGITLDGTGAQILDAGTGTLQLDQNLIKASGNLTLDGALVDLNGSVDQQIAATNGLLRIVPDVTMATNNLELIGGNEIDLNGTVNVQNGSLTVQDIFTAGGDLTANSGITLNGSGTFIAGGNQLIDAGSGALSAQSLTKASGNLTLDGSQLDLNGTVDVQAGAALLNAQANLAGDAIGSGGVTFDGNAIFDGVAAQEVNAGGGILQANGTIDKASGTDLKLIGSQIVLTDTVDMTTDGNLDIQGTTVALGGDVTVGNGTGAGILAISGNVTIDNGSDTLFAIKADGDQIYQGNVTLNNNTEFQTFNSSVTYAGTLNGQTFNITFKTDELEFNGGPGTISGSGLLAIEPTKVGLAIEIGLPAKSGAVALDLNDDDLAALANGFAAISIGRAADGAHAVTIETATFKDDVTIHSPAGSPLVIRSDVNDQFGIRNAGAITILGSGSTTNLEANIQTNGQPVVIQDSIELTGAGLVQIDTTFLGATGADITLGDVTDPGLNSGLRVDAGEAGAIVVNNVETGLEQRYRAGAGITALGTAYRTTADGALIEFGNINDAFDTPVTLGNDTTTTTVQTMGNAVLGVGASIKGASVRFGGPLTLAGDTVVQTNGSQGADIVFGSTVQNVLDANGDGRSLTVEFTELFEIDVSAGQNPGQLARFSLSLPTITFVGAVGSASDPLSRIEVNPAGRLIDDPSSPGNQLDPFDFRSVPIAATVILGDKEQDPNPETMLGFFAQDAFVIGQNEKLTSLGQLTISVSTGAGDGVTTGIARISDAGAEGDVDITAFDAIYFNTRPAARALSASGELLDDVGLDIVSAMGTVRFETAEIIDNNFVAGQPQQPVPSVSPLDANLRVFIGNVNSDPMNFSLREAVDVAVDLIALVNNERVALDSAGIGVVDVDLGTALSGIPETQQIADVPNETILEQSQRDQLRQLGIFARDLTTGELVGFLGGGAWVINDIPEYGAGPSGHQVAIVRVLGEAVTQALATYNAVYWKPVINPETGQVVLDEQTGRPKLDSQAGHIRQVLSVAFDSYLSEELGVERWGFSGDLDAEAFRQYLENSPSQSDALGYVVRLGDLFSELERAGITPRVLSNAKQVLLGQTLITPEGMSWQQLDQVIQSDSHSGLGIEDPVVPDLSHESVQTAPEMELVEMAG